MKRFLLLALLALPVLGLQQASEPASQDATAAPAAPEGDAAGLLKEAQDTLRVLNRISDALPREPLEPSQLAALIRERGDRAREALVTWIAESIGWLPYRGALRGPRGVLIERRGNSLDQSLLLAQALRAAGLEARLAHAVVPVELAAAAHAALRARDLESRTPPARDEAEFERWARLFGADPASLRSAYEALDIQGQQYLERVLPTTVRQTTELQRLLAEGGTERPAVAPAAAEEIEALRDHWWVQASEDGESWTDHDALAARAGMSLAAAPEATYAPEELPESARHQLTLRVVAERTDAQGVSTRVALAESFDAAELAGSHFRLAFRPLSAELLGPPAAGEAESGEFTLRAVTAETEWLPVLSAIDYRGRARTFQTASIKTDGTVDPSPRLDTKVRRLGLAADALGGGAGLRSDSFLSAVWLEYELTSPARTRGAVRRQVFDLLGEARRRSEAPERGFALAPTDAETRGLALAGLAQILPATCQLSGDFLLRLDLLTKRENLRLVLELAAARDSGEGMRFADVAVGFAEPPLELFQLARMRLSVGRHAARTYLGAANVFANHVRPVRPSAGRARELAVDGIEPVIVFGRAVDVVVNGVGVLALSADEPGLPAWDVRLEQGVLDTVLENLSLVGLEERVTPDGSEGSNERALADNAAVWMHNPRSGPWRALSPGTDLDVTASDAHARVAAALASGHVAVVPRGLVADETEGVWRPGSWWRVDAATGETLGIGPRGWGQDVVEDLGARVNVAMKIADPLARLNASLLCFFAAAGSRLLVSTTVSTVGDAVGAPELLKVMMAMISQAGYAGVIYAVVELRCKLMVLGA